MQNLNMFDGKKSLGSFLVFLLLPCSYSIQIITPKNPLKDGDVLLSQGESFALGFFSLTNSSTNRYVGVWYNKISEHTVVWVLNRDNPINGTTGILYINTNGNLALAYQNLDVVWSTNISETSNSSSAQLLDSGNLVLYNDSSKNHVAWQGFDYPTNTVLPDMKQGFDKINGLNWFFSSWKSAVDPGTGEYTYKLNISGSPQFFLNKGSAPVWRTGPWNGLKWNGVPEMSLVFPLFNVTHVDDDREYSVVYSMRNTSIFSRIIVNESGSIERYRWDELRKWVMFFNAPTDQCDYYGVCGLFGICNPLGGEFHCACLPGYEPMSPSDWSLRDASAGCVRKRGVQGCGNGDGFVPLENVRVPDSSTLSTRVDKSIGRKACEEFCLTNCTCLGYTSADITKTEEESGCISWHGDMIDVRQFSDGGQDFYICVDAVELADYYSSKIRKKRLDGKQLVAIIIVSIAMVVVSLGLVYWWVRRKKRGGREQAEELLFDPSNTSMSLTDYPMGKGVDNRGPNADLPSFALGTVVAATNNFSLTNKLGEGGFGSVYKGRLRDGHQVAIKRLSDTSRQGMQEFKNEVTLIAKLQHRNLVRLLGYCIEKQEKILIYEYMPNKGLDTFIFDKDKGQHLDWKKRFEITMGISRGMSYLHQDSRLRIIHRDLKASNVLLDESMNPKISDFGMARIFGGEQMEAITKRVVGTYGYMSPEYAMEGLFSIKSDVFSFGVLLLEIISGRKNSSYYRENSVNLIGHVWALWGEGRAMEIIDSSLGKLYDENEVKRCIHIGLLCVQEYAVDRPTMSEVAFMLCHDTNLPSPKQLAFIFRQHTLGHGSTSATASTGAASVDKETITTIVGR